VLARDGLSVVLLERQTAYRDKVRGEAMVPWGAAEARRLGLEETLLEAGGSYAPRVIRYDETLSPEEAEQHPVLIDRMVPGIGGFLNVGHPEACLALSEAAENAGATVVRGTGDVKLRAGPRPKIRYELAGQAHDLECRLVVGADGPRSTVRAQAGIRVEQNVARTRAAGLLLTDLPASWPQEQVAVGTEGRLHYLVFPRQRGRARLYLLWDIREGARSGGPGGVSCVVPRAHLHPASRGAGRSPGRRTVHQLPDERWMVRQRRSGRRRPRRRRRRLE
jgi:2-polyprenyl-6-methoxyphenol hydroxylase-like FAD-dependent oxidoreductase